jgi:hypothetical protein
LNDQRPITKRFTKRLSTRRKFWKKRKINCLDKKNKSKSSTNKSRPLKRKEIPILSKPPQQRPSTFMPEIKSSWETTLLLSSKNKTWKLSPNSKSNSLCMRLSGLIETLFQRNLLKYKNKKVNTATGIAESHIKLHNSKKKSIPKKLIWSSNTTNTRKRTKRSKTKKRKSVNMKKTSLKKMIKSKTIKFKFKSSEPLSRKQLTSSKSFSKSTSW